LLVGLLACLTVPASAAAGDLDQQQILGPGARGITSTQSGAQTFTAGRTGLLDQVDLNLAKGGSPVDLTVELRDVAAGEPGTQVLAAASVPASSVPLTAAHAFVSIPFAVPASVTAGTQYAIVAYTAASGVNYYYWWDGGPPSPYAGGVEFLAPTSPPVAPWTPQATIDFAFKTYVAPPVTPPASTPATGLRAAALHKCKKKPTKQKRRKCRRRANKLPV
jgi:hypothetical protein